MTPPKYMILYKITNITLQDRTGAENIPFQLVAPSAANRAKMLAENANSLEKFLTTISVLTRLAPNVKEGPFPFDQKAYSPTGTGIPVMRRREMSGMPFNATQQIVEDIAELMRFMNEVKRAGAEWI
jgi:hypothetical protein